MEFVDLMLIQVINEPLVGNFRRYKEWWLEYGGRDYQKEYERINNSRGWDAKEREIYLLRKDILKGIINQDEPFNELNEIEKDFLLKETIIWSDLDRNYYGCSPFSYRNIEDGVPYIDTYRNNQKTTQKELSNV